MRMVGRTCLVAALCGSWSMTGCDRRPAPPSAEPAPSPVAAPNTPLGDNESSYAVDAVGKATVSIEAPLEKFQGHTPALVGYLRLNPRRLDLSTGTIGANLAEITTHTFGAPDKDSTQTEHVRNWLEIGEDVKSKRPLEFERLRDAFFRIDHVEWVEPATDLTAVPERAGVRTVTIKVTGSFWLHGRRTTKVATLRVKFKGPPEAPTELSFESKSPMYVSLTAHDVKPRDSAGKFLAGALEAVGRKMDDEAGITIEGTAHRDASVAATASAAIGAKLAGLGPATP